MYRRTYNIPSKSSFWICDFGYGDIYKYLTALSIVRYKRFRVVYVVACFDISVLLFVKYDGLCHHQKYPTDMPWNNFLLDTTYLLLLTCYQSILWINVSVCKFIFFTHILFCIFNELPHQNFWFKYVTISSVYFHCSNSNAVAEIFMDIRRIRKYGTP